MLGHNTGGKRGLKKNLGKDDLEIDLSRRFKYESADTKNDIYPMMYHLQRKEYSQFLRGAKSFAIKKITDQPRQQLEDMIDLRQEILALGNDLAARTERLQSLIKKNMYDAETDKGLLRASMTQYKQVVSVDREALHSLVDGELERAQESMADALQEAKNLITRMEGYLNQNENKVKDFLETHNHEVNVLSKPKQVRSEVEREVFSNASFRGQSMIEAILNSVDVDSDVPNDWKPELYLVPMVGLAQGIKFSWPTKKQLLELPLDKQIKLNGFGFKASNELNELQLYFTSGAQSPALKNAAKATGLTRVEIDTEKPIGSVGLLQHPTQYSIYGLRLLDSDRAVIVQEIWQRDHPEEAMWVHLDVPEGKEIVGLHGNHDGSHIRAIGLQVWTPNPAAVKQQQQQQ